MEDFDSIRKICQVSSGQHASQGHPHVGNSIVLQVQQIADELLLEELWVHKPCMNGSS